RAVHLPRRARVSEAGGNLGRNPQAKECRVPVNPPDRSDVSRETEHVEPAGVDELSSEDPRLASFFGDAFSKVRAFHDALAHQGELRGLIGPREVPRLWSRHLLNSASVVPFLPAAGM